MRDVLFDIQVMRELLTVWADSSAVRHTSVEQHLYITKALLIGLGFLKESDKAGIRDGKRGWQAKIILSIQQ